jgi:heme oxygenase
MAGVVASPPAHRILRESTRAAHDAAEETAGMCRLMAGELDEAGYAGLLLAQLALFREWERERGDWLAGLREWNYVSRAALLEADLAAVDSIAHRVGSYQAAAALGERPVGAHEVRDAFPRNTSTGTHPDPAACWGELYVIEGSALGGRIIVRRLRELYPRLSHGFYAIGEDKPPAWRRFQGLLDANLVDEASQATAVAAARAMFARFQQTLQDPAA